MTLVTMWVPTLMQSVKGMEVQALTFFHVGWQQVGCSTSSCMAGIKNTHFKVWFLLQISNHLDSINEYHAFQVILKGTSREMLPHGISQLVWNPFRSRPVLSNRIGTQWKALQTHNINGIQGVTERFWSYSFYFISSYFIHHCVNLFLLQRKTPLKIQSISFQQTSYGRFLHAFPKETQNGFSDFFRSPGSTSCDPWSCWPRVIWPWPWTLHR